MNFDLSFDVIVESTKSISNSFHLMFVSVLVMNYCNSVQLPKLCQEVRMGTGMLPTLLHTKYENTIQWPIMIETRLKSPMDDVCFSIVLKATSMYLLCCKTFEAKMTFTFTHWCSMDRRSKIRFSVVGVSNEKYSIRHYSIRH